MKEMPKKVQLMAVPTEEEEIPPEEKQEIPTREDVEVDYEKIMRDLMKREEI